MSSIQEQIFQAIDIITDKKVRELKFDKTIEGLIVSDEKADIGEYQVQYQDIRFSAYSSNNTVKFKKDDNVLILVPDGDMSNKKTILSSSNLEGEEYVNLEDIVIDKLGINFLDEAEGFSIDLSTYQDDFKPFNVKGAQMVSMYPGQKMIWIGAEIYSNINTDYNGDYGIEIECAFSKPDNSRYNHTFRLSLVDIVGNPYQSRGYKYTQLPLMEDRLVEVIGARAYSVGFRGGFEDIKISNIEIEYVKPRDQDGSEYTGNIITPDGTHLKNEVLFPTEVLELIMQFKQKGQVLDTDAITYKWFIMDASITSTDDDRYSPDAGLGWKLILPGDYSESLIEGANTKALRVWAGFVPNFETFKCVAYYKTYVVSDMVTIVDHTDEVVVEMTSTKGASFVNGVGSTEIICDVKQSGEEIPAELIYSWTRVSEDGTVTPIKIGNDKTLKVNASEIDMKKVYICEVSVEGGVRPIGTGNIALVNIIDGATHGIVVVGGFRTVLYDADGYAPELLVDGFQFDLYKNGDKVVDNLKWTWYIPKEEDTLLTMPNGTVEADGRRSSTDKILYLNIVKNFSSTKMDNTLTLVVEHTELGVTKTFREVVNISITKVGNNGADGSAGKPGLDGNTYVYEIQGGTPTIIYDKNGLNPNPSRLNEFYLMFSENGNNTLASKVDSVEWSLETSRTSILSFEGTVNRRVTTYRTDGAENPHKVVLIPDESWTYDKFNNFLSAEITYKGMSFREYYPISVTKNGSDGKPGEDGAPGENSKYIIISGQQIFKKEKNASIYTPTTITLTAQRFNVSETGRWYTIVNGIKTLLGTGTTQVIKPSDSLANGGLSSYSSGIVGYEINTTVNQVATTIRDEITMAKLVDGDDGSSAITMLLSNENHSVPADVDGTVVSSGLVNAKTDIKIYDGTADVTGSWNVAVANGTGLTGSVSGTATKTYTVTAFAQKNGADILTSSASTLTATRSGYPEMKKVFSITKALKGQDGADGKPGLDGEQGVSYTLNIVGGARGIAYSAIGDNPTPSTTGAYSVELLKNGDKITPAYYAWSSGGSLSGTGSAETFTPVLSKTISTVSATFVKVVVRETSSGADISQIVPIVCTKHADGLDWIGEWDQTKVSIDGEKVLAGKIYAGTVDNGKLNGVAIGTEAIMDGSKKRVGVVGYKANNPTFLLDTDGKLLLSQTGNSGAVVNGTGKGLYWDGDQLSISGKIKIMSGSTIGDSGGTKIEDVVQGALDGTASKNAIKSVDVEYAINQSATTKPTSGWETNPPEWKDGWFIWSRTTTTLMNGGSTTTEPVCITGAYGTTGPAGQGVQNIVELYKMLSTKAQQPTPTSDTGWSTTPPTWQTGQYIHSCSKIIYTGSATPTYTTPVCDSSWEAVNDIEIGGTNLQKNSDFSRELGEHWAYAPQYMSVSSDILCRGAKSVEVLRTNATTTTSSIYLYSGPDKIPAKYGEEYTMSFEYFIPTEAGTQQIDGSFQVGVWFYKNGSTGAGSNRIYIEGSAVKGEWTKVSVTGLAEDLETSSVAFVVGFNKNAHVYISRPKLERGNKATDWTPAPEDIEQDVIDANNSANDALNNASQAQNDANSANGRLDDILMEVDGDVLIRGDLLTKGSITGDMISAGSFRIQKGPEGAKVTTFDIDKDGNVMLNGTLKSDIFDPDNNLGYQITPDGVAVLNQARVSGEFIMPNAGITNYGATLGNENLVVNSNVIKNTDGWGLWNSNSEFISVSGNGGYIGGGFLFGEKQSNQTVNNTVGVTTPSFSLIKDVKYTLSFVAGSASNRLDLNYMHIINGAATGNLKITVGNVSQYEFYDNTRAPGTTAYDCYLVKVTFTAGQTTEAGKVLFGFTSSATDRQERMWIRNVKLEQGQVATPWCPNKDEQSDYTRIWAGSNYEKRDLAPFRVNQNGDLWAENAVIGGRLIGNYDNGNIHIHDNEIVINKEQAVMGRGGNILNIATMDHDTDANIVLNNSWSLLNNNVVFGSENNKRLFFSKVDDVLSLNMANINISNSSHGALSLGKFVAKNPINEVSNEYNVLELSNQGGGRHNFKYVQSLGGLIFDSVGTQYSGALEIPYDFKFERMSGTGNVNVKIQGTLQVTNAINSNKHDIEMRSTADGWGFFAN